MCPYRDTPTFGLADLGYARDEWLKPHGFEGAGPPESGNQQGAIPVDAPTGYTYIV